MANIDNEQKRPWDIPGESKPWNPRDESGKPFANAKRHNGGFYQTPRWRHLRDSYFKGNPLCEICQRDGYTTKGYFVDHIIPISRGGEPYNVDNLQTLCKQCHAIKTNKEIAERRREGG